jgi:hypothetical protein
LDVLDNKACSVHFIPVMDGQFGQILTAHNPKVAGSNPAPATIQTSDFEELRKGRP